MDVAQSTTRRVAERRQMGANMPTQRAIMRKRTSGAGYRRNAYYEPATVMKKCYDKCRGPTSTEGNTWMYRGQLVKSKPGEFRTPLARDLVLME
jgi:hypothetical protein